MSSSALFLAPDFTTVQVELNLQLNPGHEEFAQMKDFQVRFESKHHFGSIVQRFDGFDPVLLVYG